MKLDHSYLNPFDRTYATVTESIKEEAQKLSSPASDWLLRLVASFQQERSLWNERPELRDYRLRWLRFNSKLMRLVAGAYLHIGYDLPRALADDWPGKGRWLHGPVQSDGQAIYFRIGNIFPESLVKSARDVRTMGFAAVFLRLASRKALSSAGIWVDALRKGAWLHAEILSNAPDRKLREDKMAEAITAALEDAFLIYPWSIMRLLPPDSALYSPIWATLFSVVSLLGDYALVAVLVLFFSSRLVSERNRLYVSSEFIFLWGNLTSDYVSFAAREPETFANYRQRRRSEFGILPEAGTSPF